VAVIEPDAVAFADRVAALPEVTVASVASAGMPVPVIFRPASSSVKVFAAAVSAVEALVVVTVTERGRLGGDVGGDQRRQVRCAPCTRGTA